MNPLLAAWNCTPRVCAFGSLDSNEPVGVPSCQMLHGHCSTGVVTVAELDGVLTLPAAS